MRDDSDRVADPGDGHDVKFAKRLYDILRVQLGVRRHVQIHEEYVGFRRDAHVVVFERADAPREVRRGFVVAREVWPNLFVRGERGGGERPRLPHTAPARLPQSPALRDERLVADDHRPYRRAEALGETHRNRVGGLDASRRRDAEFRCGVPDPRAVDVESYGVLFAQAPDLVHVRQGKHLTALLVVRVLQAHHGRAREVLVVRADGAFDRLDVDRPVRVGGELPGVRAHERREPALLVLHDVRQVAADVLRAAHLAMHAHGHEVAHRAARHEDRRFLPEDLRHGLLQPRDRGVVAEDVVPHLGASHGVAHLLCRPGHRVAPQVPHRTMWRSDEGRRPVMCQSE